MKKTSNIFSTLSPPIVVTGAITSEVVGGSGKLIGGGRCGAAAPITKYIYKQNI